MKNKFDKNLKQKLSEVSPLYNPEIWDSIASELDSNETSAQKSKKRIAIASLYLAFFVSIVMISGDSWNSEMLFAKQNIKNRNDNNRADLVIDNHFLANADGAKKSSDNVDNKYADLSGERVKKNSEIQNSAFKTNFKSRIDVGLENESIGLSQVGNKQSVKSAKSVVKSIIEINSIDENAISALPIKKLKNLENIANPSTEYAHDWLTSELDNAATRSLYNKVSIGIATELNKEGVLENKTLTNDFYVQYNDLKTGFYFAVDGSKSNNGYLKSETIDGNVGYRLIRSKDLDISVASRFSKTESALMDRSKLTNANESFFDLFVNQHNSSLNATNLTNETKGLLDVNTTVRVKNYYLTGTVNQLYDLYNNTTEQKIERDFKLQLASIQKLSDKIDIIPVVDINLQGRNLVTGGLHSQVVYDNKFMASAGYENINNSDALGDLNIGAGIYLKNRLRVDLEMSKNLEFNKLGIPNNTVTAGVQYRFL
jgi:hypothetical protein